jgi:hypothetical protein
MKQSWMVAIACLWIGLNIMCSFVTTTPPLTTYQGDSNISSANGTPSAVVGKLEAPNGTDLNQNALEATVSFVTDVWTWFKTIIQICTLWYPSVWQGDAIYFYWFLCIPCTIGMVLSFVTILRGVHSS